MAIGRCCNIDGAIDGTWRAGVETGEDGGNRKGEISPIGDEHKDREKEKNGYILQCTISSGILQCEFTLSRPLQKN